MSFQIPPIGKKGVNRVMVFQRLPLSAEMTDDHALKTALALKRLGVYDRWASVAKERNMMGLVAYLRGEMRMGLREALWVARAIRRIEGLDGTKAK